MIRKGLVLITALLTFSSAVSCGSETERTDAIVPSQEAKLPAGTAGSAVYVRQSIGGPTLLAVGGGETSSYVRESGNWRKTSVYASPGTHSRAEVVGDSDQLVTLVCSGEIDDEGACSSPWRAVYTTGQAGSVVSELTGDKSSVLVTTGVSAIRAVGADGDTTYLLLEEGSFENRAELWALDRRLGSWRRLPHPIDRNLDYCVRPGDLVVEMRGLPDSTSGSASPGQPYREPSASSVTLTTYDATTHAVSTTEVRVEVGPSSQLACPANGPAVVGTSEIVWPADGQALSRRPIPVPPSGVQVPRAITWSPRDPEITVTDRAGDLLALSGVARSGEVANALTKITDAAAGGAVLDAADMEFLTVAGQPPTAVRVTPAS